MISMAFFILSHSFHPFKLASSTDALKDPSYKPCYVPGASGLPSLDNIPSVADLTANFAARKEERLKQEAEKKEEERRVSLQQVKCLFPATLAPTLCYYILVHSLLLNLHTCC